VSDPYGSKVREFHEKFGLVVRDTPDTGFWNERQLRVRLMLEEVLEFAKAAGVMVCMEARRVQMDRLWIGDSAETPDLTAMAHELADVAYVTHGTAVQLGIPLLAVTAEVHAANMRKLGPDGKPIINAQGKVQKPEGWKPADVGAVLANKTIPVVQEPPDMGPAERCCFCRKRTRMWTALHDRSPGQQVACCEVCAKSHVPKDVPTKAEWFRQEDARR